MNITIIGSGYVGLCTGVGFAIKGHSVTLVDKDRKKIDNIKNGVSPIYEPGVEERLKEYIKSGSIKPTEDLAGAVKQSDVTFICVGTPSNKDGSIDVSYIKSAAGEIGKVISSSGKFHVIVVKSTVVPGTTESIVQDSLEAWSGKRCFKDFGLCMNPEFLREGHALHDFLEPDRIVLGFRDEKTSQIMQKLYSNFHSHKIYVNIRTAEMIKYASNAFLATKISFINEVGNMCKKLGIDVYDVADGMGYDKRIGRDFLNAGSGWGGSCFPKDISALISKARSVGNDLKILESVYEVNARQKTKIIDVLKSRVNSLKGKNIAVLGLAFKSGTDDVRDSVAIDVIDELKNNSAKIYAYDPKAMNNMKMVHPDINYMNTSHGAIKDADACLLLTDWDEFKKMTDKDFNSMKSKIIIEGRRILDRTRVKGFEGVCW